MARKTKLTPELQRDILQVLEAGATIKDACHFVGISEVTYFNWINRGEEAKSGIYFEFLKSAQKAIASGSVDAVAIIRMAAKEQWQAAAWFLERKNPQEWARRTKVEIDISKEAMTELRQLQALTGMKGHDLAEVFRAMIAQYSDVEANE